MMNNKNRVRLVLIIGIIVLIVLFGLYFSSNNKNKEYLVGLTYAEFQEKLENKESFILCVSQTTCSHCASYKPKLKEVASEYKTNIYYTDIDTYSTSDKDAFDKEYSIDGTPTTLIFIDGKEESIMNRISGDVDKDTVINTMNKYNFIKK